VAVPNKLADARLARTELGALGGEAGAERLERGEEVRGSKLPAAVRPARRDVSSTYAWT
jgi:hypothetical protein